MAVDEQSACESVWTGQRIALDWSTEDDPSHLRSREWLVTNGLGGYASGTLSGLATRRYHGLLVPNLPAPRGRTMLIPHLEETVEVGQSRITLGELQYADGNIRGQGPRYLRSFQLEWLVPTWRFEVGQQMLTKSIAMPYGRNSVCVKYECFGAYPFRFHLRPFLSLRPHNQLGNPAPFCSVAKSNGGYEFQLEQGSVILRCLVVPEAAQFVSQEQTIPNILRRIESDHGYEAIETLQSPGYFNIEVGSPQVFSLFFSTDPWHKFSLKHDVIEASRRRANRVLRLSPRLARHPMAAQLMVAADQFITAPGARSKDLSEARRIGERARTVIAGYHWFTDWGRDTMISLEGLTLLTGRFREARRILITFARYIRDGLIPNQFPEGKQAGIYNTIDATLWYFHALDRYLHFTNDRQTLEILFPLLRDIIARHFKGTQFGIGIDERDGLLRGQAEGAALTWMDAKVGDWVVTPRAGKPVEIQALWYNALCLMSEWSEQLGQDKEAFRMSAEQAAQSFRVRFWNEEKGCLYDVIDGPNGDDARLRPNQLLALSLRYSILSKQLWKPVLDKVTEHLLTPLGLRTLGPHDPDYKPTYQGDLRSRDAAYHQGTVWPWLIGPFVDAWMKVYPEDDNVGRFLTGFTGHLSEAGMGTISEIFDAEHPFTPRGCIAQAWSVAEVLRALVRSNRE